MGISARVHLIINLYKGDFTKLNKRESMARPFVVGCGRYFSLNPCPNVLGLSGDELVDDE